MWIPRKTSRHEFHLEIAKSQPRHMPKWIQKAHCTHTILYATTKLLILQSPNWILDMIVSRFLAFLTRFGCNKDVVWFGLTRLCSFLKAWSDDKTEPDSPDPETSHWNNWHWTWRVIKCTAQPIFPAEALPQAERSHPNPSLPSFFFFLFLLNQRNHLPSSI